MKTDDPDSKSKSNLARSSSSIGPKLLNSENAIMVPNTSDGRVLFAVPWHDVVIVGTTDTEVKDATIEPIATDDEIDFILSNAEKYMTKKPTRKDVKSVFTGLRP